MPEQRVSVLAVLNDRLTNPLNQLARKVSGFFGGIQTQADKLRNPTSNITGFLGGFLGIAAAQRAIEVAKGQADALGKLRAAAGGSEEALRSLKGAVDDLSASTGIDDDELAVIAAQMRKVGIEADRIPRALAAAVDTSRALTQPLTLVAKALATAEVTGTAPRISQLIPELKELENSGNLAGRAIEVLESKFAGFATASKDPVFLKLAVAGEKLEDEVGSIGRLLAVVQTEILNGLRAVLGVLGAIARNPAVAGFVEGAAKVVGFIVSIVTGLAALRLGFIGLKFVAGPIISLLLKFANFAFLKFGLLTAAISGATAALFGLTAVGNPLRKFLDDDSGAEGFERTLAALKKFGEEVLAGRARLGDFFAVVWKAFAITGQLFKALVVDPIAAESKDLIEKIGLGIIAIPLAIEAAISPEGAAAKGQLDDLTERAKALKDGTAGAVAELNQKIEGLRDSLFRLPEEISAAAAESAAAVARSIPTGRLLAQARFALAPLEDQLLQLQKQAARLKSIDLATLFRLDPETARAFLDSAEEDMVKPLSDLFANAFQDQFRRGAITATELAERIKSLRDTALKEELSRIDQTRAAQLRVLAEVQKRREDLAGQIALLESRALDFASPTGIRVGTEEQLLELTREITKSTEAETKLQTSLIAQERERARIATQLAEIHREDLELRRQLAAETVDLVSIEADRLTKANESIRELVSSRRITGAAALSRLEEAAAGLTKEAARAREQVSALLAGGGPETARDVQEIGAQIDELNAKAAEARLSLAGAITDSVDAASANARQLRDEARNLADEGRIDRAELVAREANALAGLDVAALGALLTLNKIRETNPELAEQIDALEERVTALGDSLRTSLPQGSLLTGFIAGVRQVLAPLNEARELGISLGSTFAESFASVADLLFSTGRTVRDWVNDFIAGIGRIIARFLALKAVSALFGLGGVGFSEGGPVLSRAGGGPVPGVDTGRDYIPALLRGGEFVFKPQAVRKYGLALLSMMNDLMLPTDALRGIRTPPSIPAPVLSGRFAEGGSVGGSGGGDSSFGGHTLVADEVTMARLAKGGRNALRQFMRENADAIPPRRGP